MLSDLLGNYSSSSDSESEPKQDSKPPQTIKNKESAQLKDESKPKKEKKEKINTDVFKIPEVKRKLPNVKDLFNSIEGEQRAERSKKKKTNILDTLLKADEASKENTAETKVDLEELALLDKKFNALKEQEKEERLKHGGGDRHLASREARFAEEPGMSEESRGRKKRERNRNTERESEKSYEQIVSKMQSSNKLYKKTDKLFQNKSNKRQYQKPKPKDQTYYNSQTYLRLRNSIEW